jgi:alpha-mannosidase
VYLDLLTGWRDAWELGRIARDNSLALLSRAVDTGGGPAVVVWNPLAHNRTDIVTAQLDASLGPWVRVLDTDGTEVPAHVEHGGRSVTWLAADVPSQGWRAYRLAPAATGSGWQPDSGNRIANEHHRLTVDPARGGGVVSLTHDGRELIADGRVGNELAVYEEYPAHPKSGEGPWHLLPKGPVVGSSQAPAQVQAYRGPLGERLVVSGRIGTLLRYTQTLTLWRGVDRVDCRTRIDEFTGEDRLLRLRWPCPVPGAMPVSEVGDAVVGRGFALLHDDSGASVDTAQHPWTLDNPAYGWFGLSANVRVGAGSGADSTAVSVAEVVTPAEAASGPLARDLMVALVRAGVTATCSSADRPRYGHLDVDSNLPDARIALGGPEENSFTAAVLATADPGYAVELKQQLAETGRARMWVPAAAVLAAVWQHSGATANSVDLRDPGALPVLIIAGRDAATLAAVVAAVADELGEGEIIVTQQGPPGMAPFEPRTVALLNRGVPSFAVEADGTLHTALLRSCTGWPSGAWTDPPRRTAPDGSNFQLMHWTHDFDYALVAGDGDWRQAAVPDRSAEFSQPLLAIRPGESSGGLPATGSLLRVDTAGAVRVGALKAAGNPLARGSAEPVDPATVALRLVEAHGADTRVAVDSPLGALTVLGRADLLEQPDGRSGPASLHGYEIATLLARLEAPELIRGKASDAPALAPDAEAAQPLYARYWLHNRGPAPLGGLPAVAHLHPDRLTSEPGAALGLGLTAASDSTDTTLHGSVALVCPDGWSARPQTLPVQLPPGEHLETDVVVTVPPDAGPGLYPIRGQLSVTGDDVPPAWRQVVEDVAVVSVGDSGDASLLYLVDGPAEVELAAGESARLSVTVGTEAHADLAVEAHLISPWGTWEWMGPPTVGAVLPAGGTVELGFDVTPPAWAEPGTWWALIRVGCAGALVYSPAVRVTVS